MMDTAVKHVHDGAVQTDRPVTLIPGLGRVYVEPNASTTTDLGHGVRVILDTYQVDATTHYAAAWVVSHA